MLAARFDVFLVDLDGVVYIGDRALAHAAEALAHLRELGKRVRFLTNDPRPSRRAVVARLAGHGIEAAEDEVFTSGRATALYLAHVGVRRALVVGSDELRAEVASVGVALGAGPEVDAVVVGCAPEVGYRDILRASRAIAAGADFVATNNDAAYPTRGGPAPATGAIVAAVAAASGCSARVIGKPCRPMFDLALADVADRARVVMIGDTIAVDIVGARAAGISALLVADTALPPMRGDDPRRPDGVIPHLGALFEPARTLSPVPAAPAVRPQRIAPCVGAVVLDPGRRVLLVKRRDNGLWALPTGHVEPGETVIAAVVRELEEETGLTVRVERLSGLYSSPDTQVVAFPDGRVEHFVTACFLCTPQTAALRLQPQEVSDAGFFAPDALPAPRVEGHVAWIEAALNGGAPVVG